MSAINKTKDPNLEVIGTYMTDLFLNKIYKTAFDAKSNNANFKNMSLTDVYLLCVEKFISSITSKRNHQKKEFIDFINELRDYCYAKGLIPKIPYQSQPSKYNIIIQGFIPITYLDGKWNSALPKLIENIIAYTKKTIMEPTNLEIIIDYRTNASAREELRNSIYESLVELKKYFIKVFQTTEQAPHIDQVQQLQSIIELRNAEIKNLKTKLESYKGMVDKFKQYHSDTKIEEEKYKMQIQQLNDEIKIIKNNNTKESYLHTKESYPSKPTPLTRQTNYTTKILSDYSDDNSYSNHTTDLNNLLSDMIVPINEDVSPYESVTIKKEKEYDNKKMMVQEEEKEEEEEDESIDTKYEVDNDIEIIDSEEILL